MTENQPFKTEVHVALLKFGLWLVVLRVAVAMVVWDGLVEADVHAVG